VSPWEIVGAVTGLLGVYLTVRENVWCWPIGVVSVGTYIVVFAQAKLYADMGLQAIYVVLCLYGWWAWLRGGENQGTLAVARAPAWALVAGAVAGAVATWGLGTFLYARTDAALPFWDAGTTAFSLVAQWLQTRKWIANWPLWIAVDAIYVGMYVRKDLWLTAALYAVFLVLAAVGWRAWRRTLGKLARAAAARALAPS
jgi:nicotinamide mononucleotide transporter